MGSVFGILSLIFGIFGLASTFIGFIFPFLGFSSIGILILAIIFGSIGIAKDDSKAPGIVGLIFGIIGVVFWIIVIALFAPNFYELIEILAGSQKKSNYNFKF